MSVADGIIKRLKEIKWEEKSQSEIDSERGAVRLLKNNVPWIVPELKNMLRNELTGPGGHAGDDLAKRMFNHYLDDSGQDFVLTLEDMKSMNRQDPRMAPQGGIDIRKKDVDAANPDFVTACLNAISSRSPQDYNGRLLWGWDNGAISTYTINYAGKVTATGGGCTWKGTVDYFDRFDLDPRWGWSPSNKQGRSRGGERRTRIGYILSLGVDFDMKSPKANVSQKDSDSALTFDGTIVPGSTPKP